MKLVDSLTVHSDRPVDIDTVVEGDQLVFASVAAVRFADSYEETRIDDVTDAWIAAGATIHTEAVR